ncbi:MAG: hypothetical protein ACE5KE_09200 [Methanosarcinales archaeon]
MRKQVVWYNLTSTKAEGLAGIIGEVDFVSVWNSKNQTYTSHIVGFESNNFEVNYLNIYWVHLTTNKTWIY